MFKETNPVKKVAFALLAGLYAALLVYGLARGTPAGVIAAAKPLPAPTPQVTLLLPTSAPDTATPMPGAARAKLKVNEAAAWMLTAIPGVGEALAGRIVAYRAELGGFAVLAQLKQVQGVGDKLYDTLCQYLEL
ncbi:MAG: helix-hairpin-helix domain-containing protein [Oscillospiraceae bacterium]|nr:helix-hairpin-helix domain-containing protein [Oscillospiraceae bacterium]